MSGKILKYCLHIMVTGIDTARNRQESLLIKLGKLRNRQESF